MPSNWRKDIQISYTFQNVVVVLGWVVITVCWRVVITISGTQGKIIRISSFRQPWLKTRCYWCVLEATSSSKARKNKIRKRHSFKCGGSRDSGKLWFKGHGHFNTLGWLESRASAAISHVCHNKMGWFEGCSCVRKFWFLPSQKRDVWDGWRWGIWWCQSCCNTGQFW